MRCAIKFVANSPTLLIIPDIVIIALQNSCIAPYPLHNQFSISRERYIISIQTGPSSGCTAPSKPLAVFFLIRQPPPIPL